MAVRRLSVALALLCGLAAGVAASFAEDRAIVLASTTATQESGLLDHLLPIFREKTGIEVTVIVRRADEVLDGARRGEVDVVLMHARPQEEKFVADGFGVKRFDVMYNDYVLIGPKSDPAAVKGKDIATALKAIEAKGAPFVTRGDRSGTHAAELALWIVAGIDIAAAKGAWYREVKQGMDAALDAARTANAYVLSDRGSWIAFKDRGDLDIVVEGDKAAAQSVRRDAGEPGKVSEREEGAGADLHRLADLAGGAGGDRRLQGRRTAAVLPQCGQVRRLTFASPAVAKPGDAWSIMAHDPAPAAIADAARHCARRVAARR
ncbi:ABC-type tungstate transport system permease subunit [Bradyrhizobium japonicum]